MMSKKSLKFSAILNVFRTVLSLLVPLITYPYISRVLGVENIGKVNFTGSIINYFVLFSALGISTYAVREGSKKKDDKDELNKFISQCFTMNLSLTFFTYAVLALFILFTRRVDYRVLFVIQSVLIICNTCGVEWINTIFEDYLYITIRTIAVYSVSIILIFTFVKDNNDLYLYAIINSSTSILVSVLNWIHCKKYCSIVIDFHNIWKIHLRPTLVFFANKLAITFYVSADTTMLGALCSDYYVGIYSVAVKVYTIIKNILAAIYAVFIPRLSYLVGRCDEETFREVFSRLVSVITLLLLPASVGVLVLSRNIILILFGAEYEAACMSLAILSFAIVFAIFGGILTSVYNVVMAKEKESLAATSIAAIANIGLNIFMIPWLKEVGAAVTTLVAECIMCVYALIRSKEIGNYIDKKDFIVNLLHSLLGCITIIIVYSFVSCFFTSRICVVIFVFLFSISIYGIELFLLKNKYAIEGVKMLKYKSSKKK